MAYSFTAASSQFLSTATAPVTSTPFTMVCWAYTLSYPAGGFRALLGLNRSGLNERHYLAISNTAVFVSSRQNGSTANNIASATIPASINTWVHAGFVCSSNSNRVAYGNGTAGTANTGTASVTPDNFTIGIYRVPADTGFMEGYICEVGIWNIALSAADMNALAKGYKPYLVRPDSLQFYAPLVRDLTDIRKGVTITNNNTATVIQHPRMYG
jgi:hypothetical protein